MSAIRIATRRSALATAQARLVGAALQRTTGRPYELVGVTTAGDRSSGPIEDLPTTGVFVAAVRQAVAAGQAELAVHSMKDLPTAPWPGLRLAAVPVREDARDALCSRDGRALADLPAGSTVATGSPRRLAQLRHLRPDLRYQPIRGNVDTRLGRVADGTVDAVVLAVAGLNRLGRADAISQALPLTMSLPAPGQGALALETHEELDDEGLLAALAAADDHATRATVAAERSLLAVLEAGCTAPVGAHAVIDGTELCLTAVVADLGGTTVLRMSENGPVSAPEQCGEKLAARMLEAGAAELVGERSYDQRN